MNPFSPALSPHTSTLSYALPIGSRARRWAAMEMQVWSLLLVGFGVMAGPLALFLNLSITAGDTNAPWVGPERPTVALGLAGAEAGCLWLGAWVYWFCGRAIRRDGHRAASMAVALVVLHLLANVIVLVSYCCSLLTTRAIVDVFGWAVVNQAAGASLFLIVLVGTASLAHLLWCLMRIVRWGK